MSIGTVGACVRKAWLVLGANTVQLENPAAGYFCSSLDLGFPAVREVVNNRPDADGIDDRTRLMGGRVVTADITALAGAGARIDAVASQFAPFMAPAARPVLHYILDRPGAAERTLVLRGTGYAWPISGPYQRDISLQWIASDPIARDPNPQTAIAWSGTAVGGGRVYNLVFNRLYPAGAAASPGTIASPGDVPVKPLVQIYGPISGAHVTFVTTGPPALTFRLNLLAGQPVATGHRLDIDTAAHTAYMDGDPTQNYLNAMDFSTTVWPVLPVLPDSTQMTLTGTGTTLSSQVAAVWNDGYIS